MNRVLEEMLRSFCNSRMNDWDHYLAPVEFAYNNSKHSVTGYTPFKADTGRNPIDPSTVQTERVNRGLRVRAPEQFLQDWQQIISSTRDRIVEMKQRMKAEMDGRRQYAEFAVGDKVWLSSKFLSLPGFGKNRALIPPYVGPCTVTERLSEGLAYRLALPAEIKCHPVQPLSRLEPYRETEKFQHTDPLPDYPTVYETGDVEETVEEITGKRFRVYGRGGRIEYRVQYKGYGLEHAQWLPISDLQNCMDLVAQYDAEHPD